jgi:hypothetical protein
MYVTLKGGKVSEQAVINTHEAAQTVKATLHTMNTTPKKVKVSL